MNDPGRAMGTRLVLAGLGLGIVYFAAGLLGLSLTFVHSAASPVWPPTGIAIGGLFLFGRRLWPAVFLGATLFNLLNTDGDLLAPHHGAASVMIGVGNTLEAVVGATLARRFCGTTPFSDAFATLRFTAVAGVLAPLLSATIGVGALILFLNLPAAASPSVWLTWYLGDLTGALVVAPILILAVRRVPMLMRAHARLGLGDKPDPLPAHAIAQRSEPAHLVLYWLVVLAVALALFSGRVVSEGLQVILLLFLVPMFAWAAHRSRVLMATTTNLAIASFAIWGTLRGNGPLALGSPNESLLLLDLFVATISVSSLILSAGWRSSLDTPSQAWQSALDRSGTPPGTPPARAPRPIPLAAALLVFLPLFAGTVTAALVTHGLVDSEANERRAEYEAEVLQVLQAAVERPQAEFRSLAALWDASDNVTRAEFDRFVVSSGVLDRLVGAQAVEFVRNVPHAELDKFVQTVRDDRSLRSEGYPDFHILRETGTGIHPIVDYLFPLEGNEQIHGLDLGFEKSRSDAIDRAGTRPGEATASAPIALVQGNEAFVGFLLMMPVSGPEPVPGTPHGYVLSVHRVDALLAEALARVPGVLGGIEVYNSGPVEPAEDGPIDAATDPSTTTGSGGIQGILMMTYSPETGVRAASLDTPDDDDGVATTPGPAIVSAEPTLTHLQVGGRTWTVALAPPANLVGQAERLTPVLVLATGAVASVMMASIVLLLASGRARAEALAAQRTADLSVTAEELARSNYDLEQFAYVASHDLKEPLRVTTGFVHLLRERAGRLDDEEAAEYMDFIQDGVHRMEQLITDLLSFARAGSVDMEHTDVDLDEVFRDAHADVTIPDGDPLNMKIDPPLGTVHADPTMMWQLVKNLLANASLYRSKEPPAVTIRSTLESGWRTVYVTDNGIGIAAESHARIFEPFKRLHARAKIEGSGIGLATAKRIIERHGGAMGVESEPGQGATFWFRLPSRDIE